MRKYKLLLLLALYSCADTETSMIENAVSDNNSKELSMKRSCKEALEVAQNSLSLIDNGNTRSESSNRTIDTISGVKYITNVNNSGINSVIDTLMYVFNYANNKGFAIVSASKKTEGLIAITEKGYYDPAVVTQIPGFNIYINLAKKYIIEAQSKEMPQRAVDHPFIRDSIGYREGFTVGPYIDVNWGQTLPEGEFCSNGVCGCTNTAIAQIMSHYEYPASINLTYLEQTPTQSQSLNWLLMKLHQTGHCLGVCPTPTTHSSISHLLRELGHRNNSSYCNELHMTFTSDGIVPTTMSGLGFQTGIWSNFDFSFIQEELDEEHLFMICGTSNNGRHAWTLDGYKADEKVIYHLEPVGLNLSWVVTGYDFDSYVYYCHFNWGWYGYCNGYYLSGVFNPGLPGNYNENVAILPIYH